MLFTTILVVATRQLSAQPASGPMVDAHGHMGLGTLQPHPSALLDLTSTSAGFLLPRLSSAERNAIASPATGLMIFNSSLNQLEVNTGTSFAPVWSAILTSGSSSVWFTNGNNISVGGTAVNQQFIGTIAGNSQPFVVATNGIERLRLVSTGELGVGIVAPTPSRLLDVAGLPGVANIRLRSLAAAPLLAPIDPNDGVVVADANGDLEKRDPSALGLAAANEPFLSFAPDAGSLTNNRVAVAGTGIGIAVGGADDGDFTINNTGVISATGTANRVLVNATVGLPQTGSITLSTPQDIHPGASPTFVGMTLTGLAPSRIVRTNGTSALTTGAVDLAGGATEVTGVLPIANGGTNSGAALSNNRIMVSSGGAVVEAAALGNGELLIGSAGNLPVAGAIGGTTNQINVTNGAGSITLSAPQDIHAGASPTFVNANLSGLPSGSSFTNLVVSNGGLLQTRTIGSLGSFWALGGNSIGAGDVLGTTNAQDLNIITGGTANVRISIDDATGLVNVRTTLDLDGTLNSDGAATLNDAVGLGDGTGADNITMMPGSGNVVLGYAPFSSAGSDRLLKAQAGTGVVQAAAGGTDYELPLTFGNGLTRTGNAVGLGGALSGATTINKSGNVLTLSGGGDVVVSGGNVGIGGVPTAGRSLEVVGTTGVANVRMGSVSGNSLAGPLVGLTDGVLIADANGDLRKVSPSEVGGNGWGLTGNSGTSAGTNFLGTIDSVDMVIRVHNVERARVTARGYVGIGAAPVATSRLTVDSAISTGTHFSIAQKHILSTRNESVRAGLAAGENLSTGSSSLFVGDSAGYAATTARYNTFIGYRAGQSNDTASRGTFVGHHAGQHNIAPNNTYIGSNAGGASTTGHDNTFVGESAGSGNTTGFFNTFVGMHAGFSNDTGVSNTFIGYFAGHDNLVDGNTFLGFRAGRRNTIGIANSFFGVNAGLSNTTGQLNAFFGHNAGADNQTGTSNTFIGALAGGNNTTGTNNTYVGSGAGFIGETGIYNTFVGNLAGNKNLGMENTFVGGLTGFANTTGRWNTFIGANAGGHNVGGDENTFIGFSAGSGNETGAKNVLVGYQAGSSITDSNNVFVGHRAGIVATSGEANTFLGSNTGINTTTGTSNTFVGAYAGELNENGSGNAALGDNSGPSTTSLINATAIGSRAQVAQNNSLVLGAINGVNGAAANTRVGIGTTTPNATLTVSDGNGIQVTSAAGDIGLNITQGRMVLSYGTVANGGTVAADLAVVRIDDDANSGTAPTITLPTAGLENGRILIVFCDDPQGATVGGALAVGTPNFAARGAKTFLRITSTGLGSGWVVIP